VKVVLLNSSFLLFLILLFIHQLLVSDLLCSPIHTGGIIAFILLRNPLVEIILVSLLSHSVISLSEIIYSQQTLVVFSIRMSISKSSTLLCILQPKPERSLMLLLHDRISAFLDALNLLSDECNFTPRVALRTQPRFAETGR
jgi:energy-converting hydrogenase Eha subunit C